MLGTLLLSRRVLRQTWGLRPDDITRLSEQHDAVLHSIHQGVVIVDTAGRPLANPGVSLSS